MAKDVMPIDGEDVVVREDKAKAYRGVYWALASIAIFIAILVVIYAAFFTRSLVTAPADPPTRSSQP
jgi:predicted membrane-bound mannosyltransferase